MNYSQVIAIAAITLFAGFHLTTNASTTHNPTPEPTPTSISVCGSTGSLEGLDDCDVITIKGATGALVGVEVL
jgi:hypothetical protein